MELLPYYSEDDMNKIIKNTRQGFMEEILEELDECYPPENQKIPKCDFKKILSNIIKKKEISFESPESVEKDLEAIYDKKYKNEIDKNWKIIVRIYNSSKTMEPDDIAKKIVETLGYEQTVETFSVIVSIKIHDDRIYEDNRNWINSVYFASKAYDSGATTWSRENPVIYAGLDDIHTEYINQILTALRKMEK